MLLAYGSQDKYSNYYTFEEYLEMLQESKGSASGLGVYTTIGNNSIIITYVIQNSPAEAAGILAGDEIIVVNGTKVYEVGYSNALNMIVGENGSQVVLTILRDGKEMEISVTLTSYTPHMVTHSLMEENGIKIGYVKIVQFESITVTQFKNAVEELRAEGCEKFIFDLRNNPGGELNAVISMLDYLLPAGPIVHILDADKKETQVYNSDASEIEAEMVVLTNGKTASAGELFTSALRDYEKATLIGTKTYGKGCGQSVHSLSNGGIITITSFFYNPPFGENYDGVGIYPDIEVELPDEYKNKNIFTIPQESDTQLQAAISKLTK
jgi:carboxyl-terminal processing protease